MIPRGIAPGVRPRRDLGHVDDRLHALVERGLGEVGGRVNQSAPDGIDEIGSRDPLQRHAHRLVVEQIRDDYLRSDVLQEPDSVVIPVHQRPDARSALPQLLRRERTGGPCRSRNQIDRLHFHSLHNRSICSYLYTPERCGSSLGAERLLIFAGCPYYPSTTVRSTRDSTDQETVADAIH